MAKIFLDVNVVIDILGERSETTYANLNSNETYISPLALHIFFYVEKKSIPYSPMIEFLMNNNLIELTEEIVRKALLGPTKDFEDNIQLHSAAEADCDILLTSDKSILGMKFFGKTQIISPADLK